MPQPWLDIPVDTPFSLSNLPFGIFSTLTDPSPRIGVAVGQYVLDLRHLRDESSEFKQLLESHDIPLDIFDAPKSHTLNEFADLGRPRHRAIRNLILGVLIVDTPYPHILKERYTNEGSNAGTERALVLQKEVIMHLPVAIGDYTDFYAGYHHALAAGILFRGPDTPLLPNYTRLPVGYHGRASSVVVSGTPIQRPWGQTMLDPGSNATAAAPSRKLDMELELGCLIGTGNKQFECIEVNQADENHVFGYVLLNDWSARDIQAWEYQPLGPFNGKNFATTISAWVVLADALESFRTRGIANPDPSATLAYLDETRQENMFDVHLEVDITTPEGDTTTIARSSTKNLMWSFPQMIAHHTLGGCNLRTGDLLGSGTISGTTHGQRGCLLEMSENGKRDVMLSGMDVRRFLKDGDTVTLRATAGEAGEKVGFGDCVGTIVSAASR